MLLKRGRHRLGITHTLGASRWERSNCADCGIDTTPEQPEGTWEYYMVTNHLWNTTAIGDGFLCIGCLEARLGRELGNGDFTSAKLNDPDHPFHSDRLRDRLTR